MKKVKWSCFLFAFIIMTVSMAYGSGYQVTTDLWIRAVINTVEKGPIDAVWELGGDDTTSAGDRVIWGFFYASPSDVTWGSENNPDLYVKIWFDHGGRVDVNFFHVSVPDIDVYSRYPLIGSSNQNSRTTMTNRYYRHEYNSNPSSQPENYSGTWKGSWYSVYGDTGGITVNMIQSGENCSGTMDLTNTDCGNVNHVPFSGTVSNNTLTLNASFNCGGDMAQLTISGASISGSTSSGPYVIYVNGSPYDSGTFTINKQ